MTTKVFKPVFLRWLLLISLIGVGTVFLFLAGLFEEINRVDFTKISFAIFAVFLFFSLKTGVLTYRAARLHSWGNNNFGKITKENETGWFWADAFTGAGMIGTVIGFIAMMSGTFDNVTGTNIQSVITFALSKMGLALYTTAAGLVCSLLLKVQLFNLAQYIDKHEKNIL